LVLFEMGRCHMLRMKAAAPPFFDKHEDTGVINASMQNVLNKTRLVTGRGNEAQ
jgi:hypothetical protein